MFSDVYILFVGSFTSNDKFSYINMYRLLGLHFNGHVQTSQAEMVNKFKFSCCNIISALNM